jgi:hypothetical protein
MLLLCLYLSTGQSQSLVKKKSLKDFTDKMKGDSLKLKVKISGVIQMHYMNEFNTNGDNINDPGGFRILRARLSAKGAINKYVSYDLMIDPRAPEQSGILRDAFIELHVIKNQSIRLGQQKTQFGWENRQSSTELFTVNRAEMSDGVSRGENLRDVGIGLLGHIKINDRFRIENDITFTNGTRSNVRGPFDFNTKKALWGRVGMRYKHNDFKLWFGGSFGAGGLRYIGDDLVDPADDVYVDFGRIGTDLQIDHKRFFFAAEYGKGKDKSHGVEENEPMGYQALLALKTKWNVGPVVRYDVFEDEWKVLTLGAYYGMPKDRFRIITNYVFRGNVSDVPNGHDDRFYVQLQIRF